MKLIPAFIILLCSAQFGLCQLSPCGTKVTDEYLQIYKQIAGSKSNSYSSLDCINRKLSISVHLIQLEDNCAGCISLADINDCISKLTPAYSPICIDFDICSIDTIDGPFYFDDFTDKYELLGNIRTHYNIEHTINIYFLPQIAIMDVCGFATLPVSSSEEGYMCICNACITGSTIIHETGHYFGLLHTFEGGDELADQSNCVTSGDFICDTNADPDTSGTSVGSNCHYTGSFVDPNGDYYYPPVSNYMSYYGDCRCIFTQTQYAIMAEIFNIFYKPQLW